MIDSKAVVSSDAQLDDDVRIDAFAVIEPGVAIGRGSWIGNHSVVRRGTTIGENNRIHEHVSLGGAPQSTRYQDEPTELIIGNGNVIREFVTMNRGTVDDGGVTRIGDGNFLMAYVHIAHDCTIGDGAIFTNATSLAGHVEVADYAFFGGFTMIHQRCRVGTCCMTGINTVSRQDVPPYVTISGNPAKAVAVNSVGMRRRGIDDDAIGHVKQVYREVFRRRRSISDVYDELLERIDGCKQAVHLLDFLAASSRGFVR